MSQPATFLRRDPAEVTPWAETCGEIRCLVVEKDGAAAEVHQVKIHDAKLHYHAHTDEFYYVIDGQGTMTLDGTEIELHQGVVVYVPRGIKHKAVGNLTVLTSASRAACSTTFTNWNDVRLPKLGRRIWRLCGRPGSSM